MTCSHARTGRQPLQQLITPQFDLVEMHIKMLGKPSHGLLTVNDYKGNFRFEAGSVIATRASGLSGSPVVGKHAGYELQILPSPLFKFPGTHLFDV